MRINEHIRSRHRQTIEQLFSLFLFLGCRGEPKTLIVEGKIINEDTFLDIGCLNALIFKDFIILIQTNLKSAAFARTPSIQWVSSREEKL